MKRIITYYCDECKKCVDFERHATPLCKCGKLLLLGLVLLVLHKNRIKTSINIKLPIDWCISINSSFSEEKFKVLNLIPLANCINNKIAKIQ